MIKIKLLTADYRDQWDTYVINHNQSYIYHLSIWQDIFAKMKLACFYLYAVDEAENIVGILPAVLSKSLAFGCFITSVPYYNYAGILANDTAIAQQLFSEAIDIAKKNNAQYVELRHVNAILPNVPQKNSKVRMVLEVPSNPEVLWHGFKAKLRSQIKRAQKENMQVRFGELELVNDFYSVFSRNMRDLGTPVWPKSLFVHILQSFPKQTTICVVYEQNIPIASGFLLGFKETLEIPSASSLRKYNAKSPNMFLYWKALEYACLKGYKKFDFGRCSRESGVYRFKKQWGAKEEVLSWEYWLAQGIFPELNPQNKKFSIAITCWQKLPVAVANFIGPLISRKLP